MDELAHAAGGNDARRRAIDHRGVHAAATGAARVAGDAVTGAAGGSGFDDRDPAAAGESEVWIRDAWARNGAGRAGFGGLLAGADCGPL